MKAKVTSLLCFLLLFPVIALAQNITGTVTDSSGEPLMGVSVFVKGTHTGAATDLDGNFSVKASVGQTLTFSYIGYRPQEVKIAGTEPLAIVMEEDSKTLDEVVVTALGIKREQKSLSYNVQQLKGDVLTTNKDANFVNSLAGKVAGVNINASSSGTGGISKVVMRGTKSIMQSSNALYVVDGMPMRGARSEGSSGAYESLGATEPIADLNPDDIESMSVLTGAAAAALYGSEAANGAIVITTKKGQAGKTKLTVSTNNEWNWAFVLPRFQNTYGAGQNGVYNPNSIYSWGSRMSAANNHGYDVADDYLGTGFVSTNSVTFSTGTDKNQTYASVASVNSQGIVPNDRYNRYNFNIRNTTNFLNDKMTLDLNASFIYQNDRNMVNQGTYMNPLTGAYLVPRGTDWSEVRMYEIWNPERNIAEQNWRWGNYGMTVQNPYWVNYRNVRESGKDRYMMGAQLTYKVLPYLTLSGRVRMDNSNTSTTDKRYASSDDIMVDGSTAGKFGIGRYKEKQIFADFLATFNKDLTPDLNLQANFGGSISDMRYEGMSIMGAISDGKGSFEGMKVGLTNGFFLNNINDKPTKTMDGWREQTQSIYASADLGYKQTYYLTLTGRNDWPSSIYGPNSKAKSYFYPSVGVSVLMNQLLDDAGLNIPSEYLSFWKIRASWASVGTSFPRGYAYTGYPWSPEGGWSVQTQYPMDNLKPERTKSWEVGMNFRFLKDFTFDATWYLADTYNQTFNPNLAVGKYSNLYVQAGNVRNWGMEFALGFDHTWGDFSWASNATFSFNRNKLRELARNCVNPVTGETFSLDQIEPNTGNNLGATHFLLREGGTLGDLYSSRDLVRDANGKIYVDADGNVAQGEIRDSKQYVKLGSVLPKGNLAWTNTFRWKNLSASCMFSARFGGIVFSRTQAILDLYGVSEATGNARDLGYVELPGGDRVNPENWYTTIASTDMVPQYYTYSATNVRLQEASISYLIPRKWLANVCDIKVSLIGRNLWMIYNKAPFDPEAVASAGNYYQGMDNFMMPSLRSVGFNVNFNF